jgi:hypothetical protein
LISHRLRDLSQEQHLFQVRVQGLKQNFPPPLTLNALPGNLSAQATLMAIDRMGTG